jgi:hypothetical protein
MMRMMANFSASHSHVAWKWIIWELGMIHCCRRWNVMAIFAFDYGCAAKWQDWQMRLARGG